MSWRTNVSIRDPMQRAALLLDAHYYQDQADQAGVSLQELKSQVERLEVECQALQANIRDLVTRVEQQVQELGGPEGLAAQLYGTPFIPEHGLEARQLPNGILPSMEQRRAATLRSYQILTQEVTEAQTRLMANQREMARLKAQQTEAERDRFWFQREYNSILYRLAPPPARAWARGRPYVPGAPVPHINGAS